MVSQWEDLSTLVEMAVEEDDASLLPEVEEGYKALEATVEEANLATLLSGEYDNNNAILNFHAGAGGTEAQDWCQMLYIESTGCICAGPSATTSNSRPSTIWTATRPG